jgi:recombination protein RecA
VRIDIRRIGQIKDGEEPIGAHQGDGGEEQVSRRRSSKCEFDILFAEGINYLGDVLDLAVEHKVVDKSGSWLTYKGDRLGQGRDRALELHPFRPELPFQRAETLLDIRLPTERDDGQDLRPVIPLRP